MHWLRITVLSVALLEVTADVLCCHDDNGRSCHSYCTEGVCYTYGSKIKTNENNIQWRQFCAPAPRSNEFVCDGTCTKWQPKAYSLIWEEKKCCCSSGNKCNAAPLGDEGYLPPTRTPNYMPTTVETTTLAKFTTKSRPRDLSFEPWSNETTEEEGSTSKVTLNNTSVPISTTHSHNKGRDVAKAEYSTNEEEDNDYTALYVAIPLVFLGLILLGIAVIGVVMYRKRREEEKSVNPPVFSVGRQGTGLCADSSANHTETRAFCGEAAALQPLAATPGSETTASVTGDASITVRVGGAGDVTSGTCIDAQGQSMTLATATQSFTIQ